MKKFLLILLLALPLTSSAATAVVRVYSQDSINAVEGTLHVPSGITLIDVSTGNSAILFWITKPVVGSAITFSGITPGGLKGSHDVFTLEGNFTESDLKKFTFENSVALKNDGHGSKASATFSLALASSTSADTVPPEAFQITVATSTQLFGGAPFIVFETQDKGSGIDHYEVAFTRLLDPSASDWQRVESPYKLPDLNHKIFVKAVDKAGNTRIEGITLEEFNTWWEEVIGLAIIGVFILFLAKKLWSKRAQP